jgi:hypothetical protein
MKTRSTRTLLPPTIKAQLLSLNSLKRRMVDLHPTSMRR